VNKWSNNLIARTLLLTMAAETQGAPATEAKGRAAINEWLTQRGLDFPELVIDNGSGLSRKTRISAQSLGELLVNAFQGPTMPELIASMAVAGVDGTMRKRLGDEAVKGRAHIKTGSLNNVNTMAGYVMDHSGRRWAVVLLINHKGLLTWKGKQVQDTLLRWVYDGADAAAPKTRVADSPSLDCGQAMTGKKARGGSS
jgi:D-alanyl-D-alanine carboxypeptidase/D-alanyl-D-alanine-endopeptidase (penicillin-binding protein 4)